MGTASVWMCPEAHRLSVRFFLEAQRNMANFFGLFGNGQSPAPTLPTPARFRPSLEGLEHRVVMSASPLKGPLALPEQAVTRIVNLPAANAPGLQNVLKDQVAAKLSAQPASVVGDLLKTV